MEESEFRELILYHKRKVSGDNGYYWWDLMTPKIAEARAMLLEFSEDVLTGLINEDSYLTILYMYFDVVYDESFIAWKEYVADFIARERPKVLPIHDTPLRMRELEYVNQQYQVWFGLSCVEFDNEMEFDYSYIEPHDYTIRSADYVMHFGKYSVKGAMRRNFTVKQLFYEDPQYLDWANRTVDSFKLSEELTAELAEWLERSRRRRDF